MEAAPAAGAPSDVPRQAKGELRALPTALRAGIYKQPPAMVAVCYIAGEAGQAQGELRGFLLYVSYVCHNLSWLDLEGWLVAPTDVPRQAKGELGALTPALQTATISRCSCVLCHWHL
jgi:hypothetical protein